MFSSYIRAAIRNLIRDKYYAFINIFGLALAFACCLILGLYLESELTYDQHNVNHVRIHRLIASAQGGVFTDNRAMTPQPLGPLFAQDFDEVESFVRFRDLPENFRVSFAGEDHYWDGLMFADANVFEVFSHQIIAGDPASALADPYSIAVSQSFAQAYFGNENPIGRVLSSNFAESYYGGQSPLGAVPSELLP